MIITPPTISAQSNKLCDPKDELAAACADDESSEVLGMPGIATPSIESNAPDNADDPKLLRPPLDAGGVVVGEAVVGMVKMSVYAKDYPRPCPSLLHPQPDE